jgi:hypothetical protein
MGRFRPVLFYKEVHMNIKKGGVRRITSKKLFESKFKKLGYVVVDEPKEEPKEEIEEEEIEKDEPKEEINLEEYDKGRGWYEYEGKSYRKDDLIELLGE